MVRYAEKLTFKNCQGGSATCPKQTFAGRRRTTGTGQEGSFAAAARKVCLRLEKRLLILTDRIFVRDLNRHWRLHAYLKKYQFWSSGATGETDLFRTL